MSKYRDDEQLAVVKAGVRALLYINEKYNYTITKEMLQIIVDTYMHLTDPDGNP